MTLIPNDLRNRATRHHYSEFKLIKGAFVIPIKLSRIVIAVDDSTENRESPNVEETVEDGYMIKFCNAVKKPKLRDALEFGVKCSL